MGFLGKLRLHPKQIATTLQFYRPSDRRDIERTKNCGAFESAKGGAVQLDGKMIDRPVFSIGTKAFTICPIILSNHFIKT
jgi:citrate lyase subunit beta/citryl-CoA lyase